MRAAPGWTTAGFRRRAHEILENRTGREPLARAVDLTLIVLIVANVAAIILHSMPAIAGSYRPWFVGFEVLSIVIFTIEYVLRVWCAVEGAGCRAPVTGRLRYMLRPLPLVDLLVLLSFYLGGLVPVDLRFMRVFRLMMVFKLTRYQASAALLARVWRSEAKPIAAVLSVLAILLVVVSSFAYFAEHNAQPDAFGSIPDAMYWAIITMTTVGYGDVVPVTALGKALSGLIGVIGLGMVALPAGLLASGFSEQLHQRRVEFEAVVDRILADGVITAEEGDQLKEFRDRLGLTDHQAAEITRLLARRPHPATICPHCGELWPPVADD